MAQKTILIVGAGPVGLTLAWRLVEAGLDVKVFEADAEISDQLRASTFHPPTLDMLAPAGITQKLIDKGRITPTWQIRMQSTGEKAEFDLAVLKDDTDHPYRLQCRQAELSRAVYALLPEGTVQFGAEVTEVSQDASGVRLVANGEEHRGWAIVGCDGARSLVRKAVGAEFEGTTYPESTILVTTHFPFEEHLEGLSGVNYIWKPGGTYSLLRLPDLWRVSLHPQEGQDVEDALSDASIRAQTRAVVPEAGDIDIEEKRVYRVHRRVASTYRKGMMFLCGDAAHLNSPKGGMGLNGGVHDAFNLAEKLAAVAAGESDALLDLYEAQRRPIARDDILAQADENRRRMNTTDPEERLNHLRRLQGISADPAKAREFLLRSSMISGLRRMAELA
ncbi:FAD-dependent oxidoreductase [Pseudooceanicola nanhaiensis]|uniref:FAD-dependent oxidoreductase n=1 Tax=Pseudooceanicola nanhaiensis TaxID=375761 RepID=UPI001CD469D6|nr:FAD-dependent monooxygenase [Pseudooceanicola nanhaiensis]MCA0922011.1 FAD-dependent monooxygenase [Pseudooceanicola nanhaiensis]